MLQRYSTEWQEFVDVIDTIEIDDKDHLKAGPLPLAYPVKVHEFNGHFSNYVMYSHINYFSVKANLEYLSQEM